MSDLARNSSGFLDKRVSVDGKLVFAGQNYFTDPRFVLVDDEGNWIRVSAWALLEFPPLPPGATIAPETRPRTMSDCLNRRFSVSGIWRRGAVLKEDLLVVSDARETHEPISATAIRSSKRRIIPAGKTSPARPIQRQGNANPPRGDRENVPGFSSSGADSRVRSTVAPVHKRPSP